MLSTFHCTVTTTVGGLCEITPHGDIDIRALPALERTVALLDAAVGHFHLDLGHVRFMDSSALRFLASVQQRCYELFATLEVSGLRPQHHRVLAAGGFQLLATQPTGRHRRPRPVTTQP